MDMSQNIVMEFVEAVEALPMDERLLYKLVLLSVCRSERLALFINKAFDYVMSKQPLLLEMSRGDIYD